MDPVSMGKRDDLTVNVWLDRLCVLGRRFEGLIDDHSTATLLGRFETAAFDVSINSPAADAVSRCVFIGRDEELGFALQDGLGVDGFNVRRVLFFSECLIHI